MRTSKYFFSLINLLTITFLLLGGCSSISVHQDYDPEYDFSKLKTFGFIPLSSEAGIDQLSADRLSSAIKTEMLAKGYTLSEQADFGVALLFSSKTKTNVQSYGYGYGYGYYGRPGYGGTSSVSVSQYEEGTLVIDVVDMEENKLVWRGIGSGALSQSPSVEERTQRVNSAVNKILAQFPPTKAEE